MAIRSGEIADGQRPPMEDAMDGMTRTDLKGVVAPLNFLVPMAHGGETLFLQL
jgi:hypothetical protein